MEFFYKSPSLGNTGLLVCIFDMKFSSSLVLKGKYISIIDILIHQCIQHRKHIFINIYKHIPTNAMVKALWRNTNVKKIRTS